MSGNDRMVIRREAFRLGRESGAEEIEGCLEGQALIEAVGDEEDSRIARRYFRLGKVRRTA